MQPPHDGVLSPIGMVSQMRHYRGALGDLADAFERLVLAHAAQRRKAVALGFVIEHVVAKDRDQLKFGDERRQSQEHEAAFWAIAAPVLAALGRQLPKRSITAAEASEILRVARETSGDLDFRQWPQQREIGDVPRNVVCDVISEIPLKPQRLAELMVDPDPVDRQVRRTGRMFVRHRDRVETRQHRAGQDDRAQDPGDRHVTVQRTAIVELQHAGIEPAANPDERQPGPGDAGGNRLSVAQREQHEVFAAGL